MIEAQTSLRDILISLNISNASATETLARISEIIAESSPTLQSHHRNLATSERISVSNVVTYSFLSFLCLISAAMAAGLTQGMLSLNPLELKVKLQTGTDQEKAAAKKIIPIISEHHVLLVTLMLFNATANEALPIFLDQLVPSWLSIIMSVTLVLMFGEIIPSAIFTGPRQLEIASYLAPFTKVLILFLSPIGYPVAMLLDYWLGHDDGITIYNRTEMSALVTIIHNEGENEHESSGSRRIGLMEQNQVKIMKGALSYIDQKVDTVMTDILDTFMLSIDAHLNFETVSSIFQSGFSRVPVYEDNDKNSIVGLLLVKDLIFVDPEDEIPLRNFFNVFGRPVIRVWDDDKLGVVLATFQRQRSHLAIVNTVDSSGPGDPIYVARGLITLEDIVEEILGTQIEDEHDNNGTDGRKRKVISALHSRDMDYVRLKILGTGNINEKSVSPAEANEVCQILKAKYSAFCDDLFAQAPSEEQFADDNKDAYVHRKVASSPVGLC